MVGENKREDITSHYKHPEKSEEERAAFQNAYNFGQGSGVRKALLSKNEDRSDFEIGGYLTLWYLASPECIVSIQAGVLIKWY